MKKTAYILALVMSLGLFAKGQTITHRYTDAEGTPVFRFDDVVISAKRPAKPMAKSGATRKERKFNKLRYNVIKVYPYARECAKNLVIIDAELRQISDPDARELYMKSREKALFGRYEPQLKKLTISQGKVLVKLIDRETGNSAYSLITDYKSATSAFFWQGIGKLFGYDLKEDYDPSREPAIEMIVQSIENGTNLTYYDYLERGGN